MNMTFRRLVDLGRTALDLSSAKQTLPRSQLQSPLSSHLQLTRVITRSPALDLRISSNLPFNFLLREIEHDNKSLLLTVPLVRKDILVILIQEVEIAVHKDVLVLLAVLEAALPELQDAQIVGVALALSGGVDSLVVVVDAHPWLDAWRAETGVFVCGPLDWCTGVVTRFGADYSTGEVELFFVVGIHALHSEIFVLAGCVIRRSQLLTCSSS